jgi:4-hydroxy-2-oxoheptanedioate aldolase
MKSRNMLQERLAVQRILIGLMQTHPNLALTELAGMCGYDFLILDAEHGVLSETDFLHACAIARATNLIPMVRLVGCDSHAVGRYLDMGAEAIIAPNVVDAAQAQRLVRAMQYPPLGTRGFGAPAHRGASYGINLEAHLKNPRGGSHLIVMIESRQGVQNVEDILAVDGVDGVFVGPFDLSADLGCAGDFASPLYAEALDRIERAATARGKVLGTGPHPGNLFDALLARGHRLLLIGADMPLIRDAMRAQVSAARTQC